jgi:hypothetical protein
LKVEASKVADYYALFQRQKLESANERRSKRQRTAALQDAVATGCAPLLPRGFGVRLSSAAFIA